MYHAWNKGMMNPKLAPVLHPTTKDIAWAAGVYEGEGYVAVLHSNGKNKHALVSVDQKDEWLCTRLRDLFGGSVKPHYTKANSPTNPELRRVYYRWMLSSARALGFVQTIYTFLSPRRQLQVRNVLDAVRS